jgi:hypothetical protein
LYFVSTRVLPSGGDGPTEERQIRRRPCAVLQESLGQQGKQKVAAPDGYGRSKDNRIAPNGVSGAIAVPKTKVLIKT